MSRSAVSIMLMASSFESPACALAILSTSIAICFHITDFIFYTRDPSPARTELLLLLSAGCVLTLGRIVFFLGRKCSQVPCHLAQASDYEALTLQAGICGLPKN